MTEKKTRDIQLSVELDASPEDVFRAVTEGTEVAKWLAPEARSTPPDGDNKARIWISWGEGMSAEHEIEVFDPPKRIRHPSGKNAETKAELYADWSIEARGGGTTTLRLVHSGFSVGADWDDDYDAHARGWMLMLQNLRHYFARHPHAPAAHLTFMSKVESSRGALWAALLDKLGLAAPPKVGDAFRFATPSGAILTGAVDFVADTLDLALVVREYGDALLRFSLSGKADAPSTFVYAYAIAYGADRDRASELLAAGKSAVSS
ncbi:MAG: SRPBCC domain-containing protein [Deltaproteobacteria bacterium]|nr:SRPBCC domain-containing protein [Deltaproteobacteria bacterium]